jgi:hypothetical protein
MIQENLKQRLDVLRGTLRKACAMDGIGRVVLATVIGIVSSILLDYFFFRHDRSVNTGFRVVMLLAFAGTVATIAYRRILSPLTVPLSIDDMALSVEREFPELNDSLISTVQLTRIIATDSSISSPMVEEVARQAHQSTAALDFDRVVKFDRIKPRLYWAGGSVALLLILCATPLSQFVLVGVYRLINPFSNMRYPELTHIAIKGEQHEITVPKNDTVHIVAEATGSVPSKAFIRFKYSDSSGYGKAEPITTMKPIFDEQNHIVAREFDYEYINVTSNFEYIIEAGDSETSRHLIRVVERPELNVLTVQYELPKYIADEPLAPKRERSLRNVVGTRAVIKGEANKPLVSATIKIGDEAPVEMALENNTFLHTLVIEKNSEYEIFLKDKDGLDNRQAKIRHKITAVPDAPPRVTWKAPNQDLEVAPTATVALAMGLDDDWGLQKALIKFKRYKMIAPAQNNNQGQNAPPPQIDPNSPAVEGSFELNELENGAAFGRNVQHLEIGKDWSLGEMGLEPGDVVEYWAEAYDWCPTVRKASETNLFHLRVLSPDEIKRRLDIERLRLIDDLKVIIRDQEGDKKQVETLKDHLSNGNAFENSERAKVSEAGALQEEVRRKTQNLQNAFQSLIARYRANGLDTPDETQKLQGMADTLGREHMTNMPEAARDITATAMVKQDVDRVGHLKKAADKQEEILTDLRALLEQMQKWAESEELLRMTRELLKKQNGVTRLTNEFKERLGTKDPASATKEEIGQVKGLEHEQRDCATDMKALEARMEQAMAKMLDLDKWVHKNISDAYKIAQNSDATPDNPDLPVGSDKTPSIQDKMNEAQTAIREKFNFGMAIGLQRNSETGLERIITVLSRRREPDQQILRDIDDAKRNLQKVLEQQKDLHKKTDNIMNKQDLQKSIDQARQQLKEVRQRQQELMNQTKGLQPDSDPRADGLANRIEDAKKNLENLIQQENDIFKKTVDQLSESEREVARSVHELDELENEERALAKESAGLVNGSIEEALRQQYDKIKKLRSQQNDLRSKATMADSAPDKAKGAEALKALKDAQSKLEKDTRDVIAALPQAADALLKASTPPSPAAQAAAHAIQQAGTAALHAPDEMKSAGDSLAKPNGKDAIESMAEAEKKLGMAEEALLKALNASHKQLEDTMTGNADRQANARGKLDEINNRLATLVRNATSPDNVQKDPKLAEAANGAAKAMPELENGGNAMGEAADTLRQGSSANDRGSAHKGSEKQTAAADKIAAARAALQGISEQLAKDKQAEHGKTGQQQGTAQTQAQGLQNQIEQLTKDIAAASGAAKPEGNSNTSGAAGKVGEASKNMGDAQADLKKPNPTGATRNESKAIDALEDARDKLNDLRRQVEELKTPARKLERLQKSLKDDARKLAGDIDKLESQMPPAPNSDKKAADNVKNASNNMQNAQNSLGNSANDSEQNSGSKGGDSGSKGGDAGSKGGDAGSKGGDAGSKGGDAGSKGGDSGSKGGDSGTKGGDSGAKGGASGSKGGDSGSKGGDSGKPGDNDKKDATKEQEQALSELDKALKALDDLAGRAEKEQDPRTGAALKRLEEQQKALRDEVLKLQKKLDQLKDKTGNRNADKAANSNQSAGKNQSSASSQMGQGNQSGAASSEEEAEQDLQEALDNLDDLQKQMQDQQRNETLFQIEQELKKMLSAQKDILGRTQEVEKLRPGTTDPLPRAAKIKVKQAFQDQLKLSDSTKVIVKKLADSPVFEWVLQTCTDDMKEAATRLDKEESGVSTQEIQEDVIRKLGELIEALRKERSTPKGGGGGGGGGGGKQPLVPPLAELKMLRIMQRDVNLKTKKIDEEVSKTKQTDLSKDQKDRLRRAAVKEEEISRITNKIADDLGGGGAAPQPEEEEKQDKP